MWLLLAILSAFFAALTTIFAKAGLEGINASLATAIRTCVVLAVSWGVVFLTGAQKGTAEMAGKNWLFLILSGVATGASWLCYYKALQMGEVSRVALIDKLSVAITFLLAIIFLHERITAKSVVGCVLICLGALLAAL